MSLHVRESARDDPAAPDVFAGPGDARALARAVRWSATSLGPVERWPEALRTMARVCLASPIPMAIWAGPELTLLPNDAYLPVLGRKAAWATGRPGREVWPEVWSALEPELTAVLRTGVPIRHEDARYVLRRHDREEEGFFTFSLSAIPGDGGVRVGVLNVCEETSPSVVALRRTERELREREAESRRQLMELQSIYDSARVGLCVIDRELRFVRVNQRLAELNGVAAAEHVGRPVEEVVPSLAATVREVVERIVRTGEPVLDLELAGTTPSRPGVQRTFVEQWLPLKDPAGAVTGVNVVVEEVTERRRAEEALADSERRYAAMFRRSPLPKVWARLPSGVIADVNDAWVTLTGIPRDEAIGRTAVELGVTADDAQRRLHAALLAEGAATRELELGTRDRGVRLALTHAQVVALGGEQFMLAALQDVTDLRRTERALRDSEERLSTALDASQVGIWEYDPETGRSEWSTLCRKLLGVPGEGPVPYERFLEVVHPEDRPRARAAVASALRPDGDGVFTAQYRVRWPDGTLHWISALGRVHFEEEGGTRRPRRMLGAVVDVTQEKEAELAVRDADRRKTEFLALLSHELRNPLAPIRNSIVLLDSAPPDSPTATRARDILRRQTDHLVRLVDDLLDLSRITHGKIEVRLARADVRELVRRAYHDARALFDERDIELLLSDPSEPLWVDADAGRFSQMVGNLLHNALKFTPPGGRVEVKVVRRAGACEVRVRDTGEGLDQRDLERIFDPFEQALRSRDAGGGLGLGLALVKGLAEKHGGSVRAQSAGRGKGSEFVVSLPLAPAPTAAATRSTGAAPRPTPPLAVVIVEDNEDAATTLAELLALGGHHVTTAATGRAGVAAVMAQRPDVLICDVGLPDMSGHDVIREIRAAGGDPRVFAAALTGYAQPQDREAALAAGFDAHLAKPPALRDLEALLDAAARARRAPAAPRP